MANTPVTEVDYSAILALGDWFTFTVPRSGYYQLWVQPKLEGIGDYATRCVVVGLDGARRGVTLFQQPVLNRGPSTGGGYVEAATDVGLPQQEPYGTTSWKIAGVLTVLLTAGEILFSNVALQEVSFVGASPARWVWPAFKASS